MDAVSFSEEAEAVRDRTVSLPRQLWVDLMRGVSEEGSLKLALSSPAMWDLVIDLSKTHLNPPLIASLVDKAVPICTKLRPTKNAKKKCKTSDVVETYYVVANPVLPNGSMWRVYKFHWYRYTVNPYSVADT